MSDSSKPLMQILADSVERAKADRRAAASTKPAPPDPVHHIRDTVAAALAPKTLRLDRPAGSALGYPLAGVLAHTALDALAAAGYEVRRVAAAVPPTEGETR